MSLVNSGLKTGVLALMLLAMPVDAGLVVRSVGKVSAAYPVGKSITAGMPIKMAPGDTLTLLDGSSTRTFTGPGTYDIGNVAKQLTTLASAADALDSRAMERKPRLGTVRGVPAITGPTLWDIDIDALAKTQCVFDSTQAIMRRAVTGTPRTLTITGPGASAAKPATVALAAGQASAPWPKALGANGEFTIADGKSPPRQLRFVTVAPPTGDATTDAAVLIKAGCTAQLERMVNAMETAPTGR